jgi:hypothetical protein
MSDKLPGSGPTNPIRYRGYDIFAGDMVEEYGLNWSFEFYHMNYVGHDEDQRFGNGPTIQACRVLIDRIEDENKI